MLGKGKSSFEYELDSFGLNHDFRDSHDYMDIYRAENGIEKMHVTPIEEGRSMQVKEPHLRFNYRYDSEKPEIRTQSYAGEMIDDENTLSKFIAPPVFESNRNKLHEQQTAKILYGTPEAQSAANANAKSLFESLNSLMPPLDMSDEERKSLGEFESSLTGEKSDAKAKSNVEYEGKYKVMNEQAEGESDEYNRGGDFERNFYNDDNWKENGDYHQQKWSENESSRHYNHNDYVRDEDGRHYDYNDRMNDDHEGESRRYREENYGDSHGQERYRDDYHAGTRSSEDTSTSYDGYAEQRFDKKDKHEEENERSVNVDQGGDKPIEVVQDDSGKLHPMSNNISKEELNNEIHKYISNGPRM